MVQTTIHYLEQRSPALLRPKTDPKGLQVRECEIKQFPINRFLYQWVGTPWSWTDRLSWTDDQWSAYAEDDALRTWVAYLNGSPAGYYELQQQEDGNVEVAIFGLADRFINLGLGGYFLSKALETAWSWEGTKRVWLHTCSDDHPHALKNYTARGMVVYKTETSE